MSFGDPTTGWKVDLSKFTNTNPYFIIALEECVKCKQNHNGGYNFNQASYYRTPEREIFHRCVICDYEWKSKQKYHEQLELW